MFDLRRLIAAAAMMTALSAIQPAAGALLLENLTNINSGSVTNETRNAESGILSRIEVGGSNVDIDQFGVFGKQVSAGNVKFAIFTETGSNVYLSGAIAEAAGSVLQWYDSPSFTLTLLANTAYYVGLISDQSFTYHWAIGVGAVSANGLTSPASGPLGSNGNVDTFANPELVSFGTVQNAVRLFGPSTNVPEPVTIALLGAGLAAVGFIRRKRRR